MTEQEIENTKNYLNANVGAFLQEDRETQRGRLTGGFPSYVCPVCGSGSGKNGSGIRTKDGIHYTCFSGNCSGEVRNVDGVDLYGLSRGISGFIQTIKAAKEEFDIGDGALEKITKKKAEKTEEKPARNFIDYYKKCAADIGKCDYMQRRGISKETCLKYWVGFDDNWVSPDISPEKRPYIHPSPRIIIPVSSSSYLARDTRVSLGEYAEKYKKMKVGTCTLYNTACIKKAGSSPLLIVEGEIDCLSVIETGYPFCIGMGSTSNVEKVVSCLSANRPKSVVIALDSDGPGDKTAGRLLVRLIGLGVHAEICDINCGENDANDALVKHREEFKREVMKFYGR